MYEMKKDKDTSKGEGKKLLIVWYPELFENLKIIKPIYVNFIIYLFYFRLSITFQCH